MVPIEKDIPLPPRAIYPLQRLAVGESFFVPGRTARSFVGNIAHARIKTGFQYTSRTIDGGVRVWRVR